MKKILSFALLGFAILVLFAAPRRSEAQAMQSISIKEQMAVITIGILNAPNSLKLPVPREYATTCGTYSVTGTFTSTEDEQDKSNMACTNGWTWWKYDNGVFTGGTGNPPK
jgi:hypothetical protein